jgi:hypothetical protein
LTVGWYCSIVCVGSETAPAAQIKDKNVKEAMIAGSHHPPAAKVGAGVFVWCGGASGQFSKSEDYLEYHPPKMKNSILDGIKAI